MRSAISADEAQDIVYSDRALARQELSEHRWYTKELVAFEDEEGNLAGFVYLDPASELQEDQDRFEADPVPIFRVTAREVTTTVYERLDS